MFIIVKGRNFGQPYTEVHYDHADQSVRVRIDDRQHLDVWIDLIIPQQVIDAVQDSKRLIGETTLADLGIIQLTEERDEGESESSHAGPEGYPTR